MNPKRLIFLGLAAIFVFTSCKKVLIEGQELDAYPVVVEAVMSNLSPLKVTLSRAVPLSVPIAPPIENATVSITEGNGNTRQLEELETGHFSTEIVSTPGQAYTLRVRSEGDNFTATALAPAGLLAIDTLTFERQNDTSLTLYCHLLMPPTRPVYARLKILVDGFLLHDLFIEKTLEQQQDFVQKVELNYVSPGSHAFIEVLTFSKPSYEFYQAIGLNTFGTNFTLSNAKNPPTNLTGGAIGFFGVALADTSSVVLW